MLVNVSVTVPVLVTVIACGALVVFLVMLPKASAPGASVKVGTTTVPLSVTDCEATGAAKPRVMVAFLVPALVGVKVTPIVQFPPTATTAGNAPQVLVWAN